MNTIGGALQDFIKSHGAAWTLTYKANEDYLLARFGLQEGLFSGLELGNQAVEKLLKSYLLFSDPSLRGDLNLVKDAVVQQSIRKRGQRRGDSGHDLEAAMELAEIQGLQCSAQLKSSMAKVHTYFSYRYPDLGRLHSKSSEEVNEIDVCMFGVWDGFEALYNDFFIQCGPVSALFITYFNKDPTGWIARKLSILSTDNAAFSEREAKFRAGIADWMSRAYPSPTAG